MPKVTQVRAAKDYPDKGIKKGEMCYVWRVRLSRGGVDCRSKTYPRPSQLNFGFAGRLGDIELDMGNATDIEELRSFKDQLEELGEECQGSFDNMPEGLQQGDTGQLLEERANGLSDWASEIDTACDEYDSEIERIDNLDPEEIEDLDEDADEEAIEEARQKMRDEAFETAKQACLDANPGL
jgi:PAS domain-containing protein